MNLLILLTKIDIRPSVMPNMKKEKKEEGAAKSFRIMN